MIETQLRVFIGFDANEMAAHNVAYASLFQHTSRSQVRAERLMRLSLARWYHRPTSLVNGQLFDELSAAPMSTDHAIARFFVPWLCDYEGWALFTDGDMLFRRDVRELLTLVDPRHAVSVVQHPPLLEEGIKKTGQVQQSYPRKNWSSVMLWNCGHSANRGLTLDVLNEWPGRDLHAFKWLKDEEIGALPAEWNYLVGVNAPMPDPAIVHYTLGTPNLPDRAASPFATEWFAVSRAAGYHLEVPPEAMVS